MSFSLPRRNETQLNTVLHIPGTPEYKLDSSVQDRGEVVLHNPDRGKVVLNNPDRNKVVLNNPDRGKVVLNNPDRGKV